MWLVRQRVISKSEPELGIGVIENIVISKRLIQVNFPMSSETRSYNLSSCPIERFYFRVGQDVCFGDFGGKIEKVDFDKGFARYHIKTRVFWEYEAFFELPKGSNVTDLILKSTFSSTSAFNLRREAWKLKESISQSPILGFLRSRVKPIPHQLFIANEVCSRQSPRVLLADEVGLGKTIEAGLIFSSLEATGRAERVLLVVTDSLVNQWLAELHRRFGFTFSVFDEQMCEELERTSGLSPFESQQKIIVSMSMLIKSPKHLKQVLACSWDLTIIDEAHHLEWDEWDPSLEWQIVQSISKKTQALLLLTATPRQRGLGSQFGLLNLIDPKRFHSYEEFYEEYQEIKEIAFFAKQIVENNFSQKDLKKWESYFKHDPKIQALLKSIKSEGQSQALLNHLVDCHGTGRVYFKNRRVNQKGFPRRILNQICLEPSSKYKEHIDSLDPTTLNDFQLMDFATGRGAVKKRKTFEDLAHENPRYIWIDKFIKDLAGKKVFVICSTKDQVFKLKSFLEQKRRPANQKIAVFHEDLSTLERDKQAAFFAQDDGPSILISSEIGGEGRNFQFVRNIILFDIPLTPEALEQRVGRLDRIGAGKEVHIFVPWLKNTPEEVLFTWFHEGYNAFEKSWSEAGSLLEDFAEEILFCIKSYFGKMPKNESSKVNLKNLVKKTKTKALKLKKDIEDSTDVLLDLNSFNSTKAQTLVDAIDEFDDDPTLEFFVRSAFDFLGVNYDDYDDRGSILIHEDVERHLDSIPGMSFFNESQIVTFDRETALKREDMVYLTAGHNLVEAIFSLFTERDLGSVSFCRVETNRLASGFYVCFSYVLQAQGPKKLELERFLPVNNETFTVSSKGVKLSKEEEKFLFSIDCQDIEDENISLSKEILVEQIEKKSLLIEKFRETWSQKLKDQALLKATDDFNVEVDRLTALSLINKNVLEEEINCLVQLKKQVMTCLEKTREKLDAIRIFIVD